MVAFGVQCCSPVEALLPVSSAYTHLTLLTPATIRCLSSPIVLCSNGFASTYAFGKHLTELLVEQWPLPGVGRALVRPALVAHTAAGPYPG
jgi:hypothetical protein